MKKRDGTYHARDYLSALRLKETRVHGTPGTGHGAIGDNGNALGPYQIWQDFFTDAKEYDRTIGHNYRRVLNDTEFSEKVINGYYSRWEPEAWNRMKAGKGTDADLNTLSRLHNGGLNWKNKTGQSLKNLDIYSKAYREVWDSMERTPYSPQDPSHILLGARKRQTGLPDSITKGGDPTAKFYTVQKGDSLWKISKKVWGKGSRHHEIGNANGLTSDNLQIGQRLFIPGEVNTEAPSGKHVTAGSTYTMKIGTKAQ